MSEQDETRVRPGLDLDRTLIRPRPGFRPFRPGSPQASRSPFPDLRASTPEAPLDRPAIPDAQGNPLVAAALPLLLRAVQIRNTATWADIDGLRARFVNDLAAFDQATRNAGDPPETLADARYTLCTFVDEAVLNTPWGGQSKWQEESLLSTFFNETWGGDRFFAILDRAKREPGRNLTLLELLFVCLVLGFEGKYHVLERGRARLDEIIDDLFRTLRAQRGEGERELSPHWRGVESGANRIADYLPLWVLAAIATALLTSLYLAFRFTLSTATDPVFRALSTLERTRLEIVSAEFPVPSATPPPEEPAPEAAPVSKLHLAELLQPEIELGLLSVQQDGLKSLIRINSDTLFRSGSATVEARFFPILERIAKAIDRVSGRVLVIGHSDDVPIHTLQFPSNWELSRARAVNVMAELAKFMGDPKRMIPEGRADTEPLVPNDSRAHRARNRRVEIIVHEREAL